MVVAIAGRFRATLAAEIGAELAGKAAYDNWGMAYCFGNRVEVQRAPGRAGALDFSTLAALKTDMAILCLNEDKVQQPWVRREKGRTWAFASAGRVPELGKQVTMPGTLCPEERLLVRLAGKFSPDDPLGLVEKHRPEGSEKLRFLLMNDEALVLSTGEATTEPEMWFGRAPLLRVVSPVQLNAVPKVQWEPLPHNSILALSRYRHALA